MEVLEIMKPWHIESLLHTFTLGTQIRFEHNFEKWRSDIGKPLKYHQQFGNHLQLKRIVQNIITEINSKSSNGRQNEKVEKSNKSKSSLIDLKSILLQYPPDGPELLEVYQRKQKFSNPERIFLINLIVRHYVQNDLEFNLDINYDIEEAILHLFPNESLDLYRNEDLGLIYNKYLEVKGGSFKQELVEIMEESIKEIQEENVEKQNDLIATDNFDQVSEKPTE